MFCFVWCNASDNTRYIHGMLESTVYSTSFFCQLGCAVTKLAFSRCRLNLSVILHRTGRVWVPGQIHANPFNPFNVETGISPNGCLSRLRAHTTTTAERKEQSSVRLRPVGAFVVRWTLTETSVSMICEMEWSFIWGGWSYSLVPVYRSDSC